ncbi:G-type lectin S-receptor-like serine/threonine-protein kinase LECRK3 isoform X2 [Rutidosis leptorrhynchoides]|uniref:G-type lectin S-receptor-like serine/threonine-protein kinase LECRK3 isoform X2 n=1 Tax=Rutidosis leptorrhynchoides TaxID=125765 RepID=UPI003A99763E
MAMLPLCLILLTNLLHFLSAQQTNGYVSVGASLTATPNASSWLSSSGEFAFGFQQIQGNDNFLLSIWYDKIPDKTIVWYPKDGHTVPSGSKVELTGGTGLVLTDPEGKQIWTSGSISNIASGFMNDTGNFVIIGSDSRNIWESFNHPTDTMLPTQVMARGGVISSKMSKTNFSAGKFQLRFQLDGNFVLYTLDIISGSTGNPNYNTGTFNVSSSTNSGYQYIFNATGYMYILKGNGEKYELTPRDSLPSGDYYHRATLDYDGVFAQYYYPKNSDGNQRWEVVWSEPENICKIDGGGACGLNNVCSLEDNRPICECPQGFSLLDSNVPNGDCKPDFAPSCDEDYREEQFDFIELNNIDWPQHDYVHMDPSNEESCKTSCLKDCFCAVAIYRDSQCWRKQIPLSNGRKDSSVIVKAFLKFSNGNHSLQRPEFSREDKNRRSLILLGSALLSTSVFVIIFLTSVICIGFFRVYKKRSLNPYPSSKAVEATLPRFTYQELVKATDGFKVELGKGAFGAVYKGVIGTKMVAVKKLHSLIQDVQKEFKIEVNTIARTNHKNLVQLLGYCDEGEQRLLIYEYMSNGTLAGFLFEDTRPSWKQRSNVAIGIAKGLAYLHEECSTQIIHCDIKPQNILLDEHCDAKIADFGLAKILMLNQSRTNTGIRGTKGYVAPEWFRNTLVSVKVDVYSFGVLLLEIVSCRKSVVFESDNEDMEVLTDFAWDCYQKGLLDTFVENDSEALDDYKKLTRFVMVGLWCVQENPSLRPTMRKKGKE